MGTLLNHRKRTSNWNFAGPADLLEWISGFNFSSDLFLDPFEVALQQDVMLHTSRQIQTSAQIWHSISRPWWRLRQGGWSTRPVREHIFFLLQESLASSLCFTFARSQIGTGTPEESLNGAYSYPAAFSLASQLDVLKTSQNAFVVAKRIWKGKEQRVFLSCVVHGIVLIENSIRLCKNIAFRI